MASQDHATTADAAQKTAPRSSVILSAAADLIEKPSAWTQRELARDERRRAVPPNAPTAVCWCAAGAIQKVNDGCDWNYLRALDCLGVACNGALVSCWNDEPGRTQTQVVAALRKAAQIALSDGAPLRPPQTPDDTPGSTSK